MNACVETRNWTYISACGWYRAPGLRRENFGVRTVTYTRHSISSLAVAGFIAVVLSAAPVGLGSDYAPEINSAFAKGGGGGGGGGASSGGGNAGGNAGSNGGGHAGSNGVGHTDHGNGNGYGHDNGHGNDDNESLDAEFTHNGHGSLSSALGNLNAAHASPTALANASETSMVGMLNAYAVAANLDDPSAVELQAQRGLLGAISNKSDETDLVDVEVVEEVNDLLNTEEPAPAE